NPLLNLDVLKRLSISLSSAASAPPETFKLSLKLKSLVMDGPVSNDITTLAIGIGLIIPIQSASLP
ncbi:11586_t:CDS:1, partial [Entrophospora sp. SA101]